jgi:hypothetical protein
MLRHTPTGDMVSAKAFPASNASTVAPTMTDLKAFMTDFPPCGCARRLGPGSPQQIPAGQFYRRVVPYCSFA